MSKNRYYRTKKGFLEVFNDYCSSSSLAYDMKISYEIRNLMNLKKGIKFAKNYDFKMAPFLIRLYKKRGHLN